MYDIPTELANIVQWFFDIIFKDVMDLGPNMKAWLLMDPCQAQYGSIANPFYNFWSGAGISIQNILSGTATVMCGIFFMVEFARTLSRVEGTTYEAVVGLSCKFCFARLAISLGGSLMTALTLTGADIINKISGSANSQELTERQMEAISGNIYECAKDVGVTGFFAMIALTIIPLLIVKAATMIAMIMAYGRLLELMLYHAFMPLPVGCLFIDNARITKRFFANYFATILQGVFMFVGYSMFTSNVLPIMTDMIHNEPDGIKGFAQMLFNVVLWSVMMIVIMMKSGSWASKVVGE